jgi:hypothetical protein
MTLPIGGGHGASAPLPTYELPDGQITPQLRKPFVQSFAQKYFAFAVGQISGFSPPVSPT